VKKQSLPAAILADPLWEYTLSAAALSEWPTGLISERISGTARA
jgi:hypothetical protein